MVECEIIYSNIYIYIYIYKRPPISADDKIMINHLRKKTKHYYRFELAETLPVGDELLHLRRPRVMHPQRTVHELHPTSLARRQHSVQFHHIRRHRLLQKHVLLLLRGRHRPFRLQLGRKRDIHRIHIRVVQHRLVALVHLHPRRESISRHDPCCLVDPAAADGNEGGVGNKSNGLGQLG